MVLWRPAFQVWLQAWEQAAHLLGPPPRVRQTERPGPVAPVNPDEPLLLNLDLGPEDRMVQAIANH